MRLASGLAALLAVCWGLLMLCRLSYPPPHDFHHHIDLPVLAIELASNQSEADTLLKKNSVKNSDAIDTLHLNTTLDLVFIPLYAAYLVLAGRLFGARLAVILPLTIVAAIADYFEDYFIFQSLKFAPPQQFVPSLIKWVTLGIVFAIIGVTMLRTVTAIYPPAVRKTLGVAHLAAAALILVAAGFGRTIGYGYSPIELANLIFSLTVVANAIGLLWPRASAFSRSSG
jgi:hypothetical protein